VAFAGVGTVDTGDGAVPLTGCPSATVMTKAWRWPSVRRRCQRRRSPQGASPSS